MRKVRPFINTPVVKVFTGIRRCGKSVMMELVRDELKGQGVPDKRILWLNFESSFDPRVRSLDALRSTLREMQRAVGNHRVYLFFDEVQELEGWEVLVNSLLIDMNADIYITGSNARLLSGELATYLAGRYVEIRMYPFSFFEVYSLLSQKGTTMPVPEAFRLYVVRGGFPFLYNYPFTHTDACQYLGDLFDSVILKDISQRRQVRDVGLLRQLILYFVANIGTPFSATSVLNYLKSQRRSISTETLYNYIEYCRRAFLLHLAQREDLMGKGLLSTQEKVYLVDHGIREALYGNNQRDIHQVLENIVYLELLRRGYEVKVGKLRNLGIDFCARKGTDTLYVQVCYLLASPETIEREFGALEAIPDNYEKWVLSLDEMDLSRKGIRHRNIREFLMEGQE